MSREPALSVVSLSNVRWTREGEEVVTWGAVRNITERVAVMSEEAAHLARVHIRLGNVCRGRWGTSARVVLR